MALGKRLSADAWIGVIGLGVMLEALLLQHKSRILKKWFELILRTYPADVATMMRKDIDPFANPVGSTISREIESILKGLCGDMNGERCSASLDAIIRIRSVQDFAPSQAVGFVFLLEEAIETTLKGEVQKQPLLDEWLRFHSRINDLALRAFDIYVNCREKIYEIRVNQAQAEKEMAFRMLERVTASKDKREKGEEK